MRNRKEQKPKSQSKAARKATAPRNAKPETKRTIKQVVIETIKANSSVSNADLIAIVKAEFPRSAFKETHAAWYRSQARNGSLTGAPIAIPAQRRQSNETK